MMLGKADENLFPTHSSSTLYDLSSSQSHLKDQQHTKMPSKGPSFFGKVATIIEICIRLTFMVVSHFWKMCTTGLLIVTLLFWTEGYSYALCFFFFGVLGLLYHAQDLLLYHPAVPQDSRMIVLTPDAFQMPFENHFIRCRDGTEINLVLIKQSHANAPTILYFHGNAGNIGHRLQHALGLYSLLNVNILMVEYRGYGKSQGSPCESGLGQDAEAAMDFLLKRPDIDSSQIMLFGRSLGGAVAIRLASTPFYSSKIVAMVVENTFTSIYEMGLKIFRLTCLKYLPNFCYKNKFPSIDCIDRINIPTLFVSGLRDELVPPKMMKDLFNKSKSSLKRLEVFPTGTHSDTWMCQGYYETWMKFIPDALQIHRSSNHISAANEYVMAI